MCHWKLESSPVLCLQHGKNFKILLLEIFWQADWFWIKVQSWYQWTQQVDIPVAGWKENMEFGPVLYQVWVFSSELDRSSAWWLGNKWFTDFGAQRLYQRLHSSGK